MNKKILIFGFLAVLMLVSLSFASAVTTTTQTTQKESPLFGTRVSRVRNIVTSFLHRDRIFLIPAMLQRSLSSNEPLQPHESTIMKYYVNTCDTPRI